MSGTDIGWSNGIVKIEGTDITPDADGYYTITAPAGSKLNLTLDFQLFIDVPGATENILYQTYNYTQAGSNLSRKQVIFCCLSIVDENGNEIGYSNAYQFEDEPLYSGGSQLLVPTDNGAAVTPIDGNFFKVSGTRYAFKADSGGNTWRLAINDCTMTNKIKVLLQTVVVEYQFG